MLLVKFHGSLFQIFKGIFEERLEGPLFTKRYIYFLVFDRQVSKNFNHIIFLFKEIIINTFF